MFEHKYDMDCKQARFTLIELKTYIHMCNQAYSSNKKRSIRYFKIFASDKNAKIALFAQVPYMGLESTFINEGDEVLWTYQVHWT